MHQKLLQLSEPNATINMVNDRRFHSVSAIAKLDLFKNIYTSFKVDKI